MNLSFKNQFIWKNKFSFELIVVMIFSVHFNNTYVHIIPNNDAVKETKNNLIRDSSLKCI